MGLLRAAGPVTLPLPTSTFPGPVERPEGCPVSSPEDTDWGQWGSEPSCMSQEHTHSSPSFASGPGRTGMGTYPTFPLPPPKTSALHGDSRLHGYAAPGGGARPWPLPCSSPQGTCGNELGQDCRPHCSRFQACGCLPTSGPGSGQLAPGTEPRLLTVGLAVSLSPAASSPGSMAGGSCPEPEPDIAC